MTLHKNTTLPSVNKLIFDKNIHKIAIIAPSSGFRNIKSAYKALKKIVLFLKNKGFKLIYEKDILDGCDLPFFAASKKKRADGLYNALQNTNVRIIWSLRGGYGASELLNCCMNINSVKERSPILIGYSDISALHTLVNTHYDIPSIHGVMLNEILKDPEKFYPIYNILCGKDLSYNLEIICHGDLDIHNTNQNLLIGKIGGGNLSVISRNLNISCDILLLEDINESSAKIYEYLCNMLRSEIFQKSKAIIIGDFINHSDNYIDKTIKYFFEQNLPNLPIFRIYNVGHGQHNIPILFNIEHLITKNQNNRYKLTTIYNPFRIL